MYEYSFQVHDVYDGDTIKGVLDLGKGIYVGHPDRKKSWQSIRFTGLNTPEKRGDSYEDGILVRDFVRKHLPLGEWVVIKTELDKVGGFGRLLGTVFIGPINLNELLIEKGYGIVYKRSTPHPGLTDDQRQEIAEFLEEL